MSTLIRVQAAQVGRPVALLASVTAPKSVWPMYMLCYAMLCYAMLCYAALRCAALRCAVLCCTMPCHAMPCKLDHEHAANLM